MPSWSTPQCLFCQRKSFKSTHKSICRSVWKYRSPLLHGPFFRPNAKHPLGDGFGQLQKGESHAGDEGHRRVTGESLCPAMFDCRFEGKLYGPLWDWCRLRGHGSQLPGVKCTFTKSFSFYYFIYLRNVPSWIPVLYVSCWNVLKVTFDIFYNISLQKIFQSSWNNVILC